MIATFFYIFLWMIATLLLDYKTKIPLKKKKKNTAQNKKTSSASEMLRVPDQVRFRFGFGSFLTQIQARVRSSLGAFPGQVFY
jgi:hypothetical protein